MNGTNFMYSEWFAIQEFWSLFHCEVGKKYVRAAKSKLNRKDFSGE